MSEDTQPNNAAPDTDQAPPLEPAPVDEVRAFAGILIAQTADAVAEAVERGIKNALADGGADALRQLIQHAVTEGLHAHTDQRIERMVLRRDELADPRTDTKPTEAQQAQPDATPKPRAKRPPLERPATRALYPHPRGR